MELNQTNSYEDNITAPATTESLGRVTVLEALAEESRAVSVDISHRSTEMGNGVDAEDD